ncbi:hypothetical protein H0H87_008229, partial [Tephrocybe sp. NHM501043]
RRLISNVIVRHFAPLSVDMVLGGKADVDGGKSVVALQICRQCIVNNGPELCRKRRKVGNLSQNQSAIKVFIKIRWLPSTARLCVEWRRNKSGEVMLEKDIQLFRWWGNRLRRGRNCARFQVHRLFHVEITSIFVRRTLGFLAGKLPTCAGHEWL